jgi:hypothetical protein
MADNDTEELELTGKLRSLLEAEDDADAETAVLDYDDDDLQIDTESEDDPGFDPYNRA